MALYKTLEFTEEKERIAFGRYVAFISESELGGSGMPQLMNISTTIWKLKKLYPQQNFDGVKLTILKVNEIETTKT